MLSFLGYQSFFVSVVCASLSLYKITVTGNRLCVEVLLQELKQEHKQKATQNERHEHQTQRLHVCLVTERPATAVCTGLERRPTDLQGTGRAEE